MVASYTPDIGRSWLFILVLKMTKKFLNNCYTVIFEYILVQKVSKSS